MRRFCTLKFKSIAILLVICFLTTSCATSAQFKKMEDPELVKAHDALKTNSALAGYIFIYFFCGIIGVIPGMIYYFATRSKQINQMEAELASRGYVFQNNQWVKAETSPSIPDISSKEASNIQKSAPSEIEKPKDVEPPPPVVAVPPQKDDSSQKPGAEKLKMEKHAAASSTSLSRKETASSEKDKSSISDKTKTSLKQNMPQEKCDAPIWNVGDSWKFVYADKKEEQCTVERIEGDLYILQQSSAVDKLCKDRKTLGTVAHLTPEGENIKSTSAVILYFDFPLYVGKKWKRTVTGKPSNSNIEYNYLHEYRVMSYEDIMVPAGTFKAFKIELNHTNLSSVRMSSAKAYIWYSPEIKFYTKILYERTKYWAGSRAKDYELVSYNFKDSQPSSQEIKLPPQGADISPSVQPSPVEKQQVPPPITSSPSVKTQGVDIPSKSQPPVPDKRQVPGLVTSSSPSPDIIVVTGSSANIRAGAGNEFPIINTVKQGDKLILLGEYGQWLNVRLENGQEGWINSRFAKE